MKHPIHYNEADTNTLRLLSVLFSNQYVYIVLYVYGHPLHACTNSLLDGSCINLGKAL